jgi:capsid protein
MPARPLSERLKEARDRKELDQLKFERKVIKKASAQYDTLSTSQNAKRKQASIERLPIDELIKPNQRLQGAAQTRNLQQNTPNFKTLMQQFKINVVGANGGKIRINSTEENDQAAVKWFNSVWAKNCDAIEDTPLNEQLGVAVQSVKREGDLICVFDDFIENTGRLRWFESDQLVNMDEQDWEKFATEQKLTEKNPTDKTKTIPYSLKNGVVANAWGRVMGWLVSPEHGKMTVGKDDLFSYLPRWDLELNPEGSAKLYKAPWRPNQYRGEGDALTVANDQQDIYELKGSEVQSAKKGAQLAGWTEVDKDADAAFSGVIKAMQRAGSTTEQIEAVINGTGGTDGVANKNYEALEGLTGGLWEYANPGEKLHLHDPARPNMDVVNFVEALQIADGASMGLSRVHSTLKAATAYTAFRGEQLMSWATFEWDQKSLERRLMDFIGYKAITWAVKKNKIKELSDGWVNLMSWSFPKMKEVDEVKSTTAIRNKLKNGQMTFEDLLGVDWEPKLDKYADQIDVVKGREMPLSIMETITGSEIKGDENQEEENNNEE